VVLDLVFSDETYMVTDPMTRQEAEIACRLFGEQGTPVLGKRVTQALIVPATDEQRLFYTLSNLSGGTKQ
jgi:hypothetical protein